LGAPPPLPSSSSCSYAFPLSCPPGSCLGLQLQVAAAGEGGVDARFAEGREDRERGVWAEECERGVSGRLEREEREDAVRRENE